MRYINLRRPTYLYLLYTVRRVKFCGITQRKIRKFSVGCSCGGYDASVAQQHKLQRRRHDDTCLLIKLLVTLDDFFCILQAKKSIFSLPNHQNVQLCILNSIFFCGQCPRPSSGERRNPGLQYPTALGAPALASHASLSGPSVLNNPPAFLTTIFSQVYACVHILCV